ncbi:MAG: ferredoxin reductase family protein [Paracoccaceae bacterium]
MLKRQGIFAVLAVLILFVALHLGLAPEEHSPRVVGTTMLGGIAFLLMTMSMILSTRAGFLEDLFGGLDRMYQVHKMAGVFAALFVLVHFFSVPKELPVGVDPLANALTPSAPFGMLALIVLILSLALALNRKIAYHRWRPAHKFMGLVYLLVIGHFMSAPGVFVDQFRASGIMLIIAAVIGVLSYGYSVFGMNKRTAVKYRIESVNHLERATELVLKPVGQALDFKPGQFAFVEIKAKGWSEPHPFTISSAPGEDNLRFTMKVLGDWTRKVRDELVAGGEVDVRGPYGRFDTDNGRNKQVWLAGGIGLTPFLSTIRAMKPGDKREIHLVYASRNEEDAIFLDELRERVANLSNVTLVPLYSEEGQLARVDIMKSKLVDPLDSFDYFMCGPKPMIDGLVKGLAEEGVPRGNIHTEAFEFR